MKGLLQILLVLSFVLTACTPSDFTTAGPSFDTLKIAFAEPITNYSPLSYETADRRYLSQIYEPLLRFDGTFNIESALAVSWGRMDDLTWDFRLREGALFHTGEEFTAEDALYSLDLARSSTSELAPLLSSIVSVEKTSDTRFTIVTSAPDPLLLNKLTYVYMVPNEYTNFELPIGTGPYRVSSYSEDSLLLERFPSYWGPLAYFPSLSLAYMPSADDRSTALLDGDIHVLANVPPQDVTIFKEEGMTLEQFPSLELSFLILNRSGVFADPNLREAVWYALSTDYAESFGGGFLEASSQYAARGIFGYDYTAPEREQNLEQAFRFRDVLQEDLFVELDVPIGLEVLGEAIAQDLELIDIFVTVNALSPQELQDKIENGTSEMYFFGWKYDLADSADFYEAVVHSKEGSYGAFNGLNYADSTLDGMIEQAGTELTPTDRLHILEDISARLLDDKSIIPLFESENLFAFRPEVRWNLRLDGQLWASEIIENVVEY